MLLNEGAIMFQLQQSAERDSFSHVVLELMIEERGYGICLLN